MSKRSWGMCPRTARIQLLDCSSISLHSSKQIIECTCYRFSVNHHESNSALLFTVGRCLWITSPGGHPRTHLCICRHTGHNRRMLVPSSLVSSSRHPFSKVSWKKKPLFITWAFQGSLRALQVKHLLWQLANFHCLWEEGQYLKLQYLKGYALPYL